MIRGSQKFYWCNVCFRSKANGLEPYHYLRWLLNELPRYQQQGIAGCAAAMERDTRAGQRASIRAGLTWSLLFHDVKKPEFNIDHVVIQQSGIYVIDTKPFSIPDKGAPKILFDGEAVRLMGFKPHPLGLSGSQAHNPFDNVLHEKAKHAESQHEEQNEGA